MLPTINPIPGFSTLCNEFVENQEGMSVRSRGTALLINNLQTQEPAYSHNGAIYSIFLLRLN